MINSPTVEKAISASTDVGGMDSNAAVILVMFADFSPVATSYAPANRPTCLGCFGDALCFLYIAPSNFLNSVAVQH